MKVRKLFSYILTILLVTSVILYINQMDEVLGIYPYEIKSNFYKRLKNPEFIHLGGGNFKIVGSKPIYPYDCIGCGELGDINVYHNSESIEMTRYTFNANCYGKFEVFQRGVQLNEKGEKIGERCIVVFSDEHSRIVWTESEKDVWIMSAPTVKLVQEFEKSQVYKSYKSAISKY
jgi:hypothetical protein